MIYGNKPGGFIYIAEFNNHPGLFKLGKATKLNRRIRSLRTIHGLGVKWTAWSVGELAMHAAERIIHNAIEKYNKPVNGQGGTEFFQLESKPVACLLASVAAYHSCKDQVLASFEQMVDRERKYVGDDIRAAVRLRMSSLMKRP